MNNLVIVESSTKASVISKYLNQSSELKQYGRFDVIASFGHIRDLAKENMGINTTTFECKYDLLKEKGKVIANLKDKIKQAKCVWLAADNDREGEAIAWHIQQAFKPKQYKRISFVEITPSALVYAVLNPRHIDTDLVNAQQSRRILDRLVGYMITKLLWKSFASNVVLSAGRVQSVAMKIIVDKELEIQSFASTKYWTFKGSFGKLLPETTMYYNDNVYKCSDQRMAIETLKALQPSVLNPKDNCKIVKANISKIRENPPLPFITSTLQQHANTSLGFSLKKTMKVAQELYEMGAISYMRTDSYALSNDIVNKIQDYVKSTYGEKYLSSKDVHSTIKKKKQANAQEAHEAIRPTKMLPTEPTGKSLSTDQQKLYSMIFNRTVAFLMTTAVYNQVTLEIHCEKLPISYRFIGKTKLLYDEGWLKVYGEQPSKLSADELKETYTTSPLKDVAIVADCTWSTPPARYNEASIVKFLEKSGIGRPSTYASILSKLFDKQYIVSKDVEGKLQTYVDYQLCMKQKKVIIEEIQNDKAVGAEKNRLVPLEIGCTVHDFVQQYFPNIVNVDFTANMETQLDQISSGSLSHVVFLKAFYKDFEAIYSTMMSALQKKTVKQSELATNEHVVMKDTSYTYITRIARYGPVLELRPLTNEKSKFINLNPYFKDTNKEVTSITKEDVMLLTSVPITLKTKDIVYEIAYGKYGFYIKRFSNSNNKTLKTVRIYKKYVPMLLSKSYKDLIKEVVKY